MTLFMFVSLGFEDEDERGGERERREQVPRVCEADKCAGWEWVEWDVLRRMAEGQRGGDGQEKGGQGGEERVLFEPLVNLFVQRPGIFPMRGY